MLRPESCGFASDYGGDSDYPVFHCIFFLSFCFALFAHFSCFTWILHASM